MNSGGILIGCNRRYSVPAIRGPVESLVLMPLGIDSYRAKQREKKAYREQNSNNRHTLRYDHFAHWIAEREVRVLERKNSRLRCGTLSSVVNRVLT